MATNRIDSLDPALIRPGRIDRKIEFPLPDTKTKRRIFGIHTGRMTLSDDVNLEEFIMAKVWFADFNACSNVAASCSTVSYFAYRERLHEVLRLLFKADAELRCMCYRMSCQELTSKQYVQKLACWHCESGVCG